MMRFIKKHLAKIVFLLAIVSVSAAFFINYLYRQEVQKSRAAIELLQLNFNPNTITVTQNQQFNSVMELTPGISFSTMGYDYTVVFDPTKVQVRHITYDLGTGFGDSDATLDNVNKTGVIHVAGNISSDVGFPLVQGQTYKVVHFDLTATSVQGSVLDLDYTAPHFFRRWLGGPEDQVEVISGQMVINGGGAPTTPTPTCNPSGLGCGTTITPTPTCNPASDACGTTPTPTPCTDVNCTTPTPTPCIQTGGPVGCLTPTPGKGNTSLNMKVKFQGITTSKVHTTSACMNVLVQISGGLLTQPVSQTVCFMLDGSSDAGIWDGTINFDLPADPTAGLVPKFYSVYLKGPKHLQKRICDSLPKEAAGGIYHCTKDNLALLQGANTKNLSGILLLAGDLPVTNDKQNGVIDSEDTTYIRNNFGSTDPTVLSKADLNLDGNIDTQDYSLVIAALSIKYDDPIEGQ